MTLFRRPRVLSCRVTLCQSTRLRLNSGKWYWGKCPSRASNGVRGEHRSCTPAGLAFKCALAPRRFRIAVPCYPNAPFSFVFTESMQRLQNVALALKPRPARGCLYESRCGARLASSERNSPAMKKALPKEISELCSDRTQLAQGSVERHVNDSFLG